MSKRRIGNIFIVLLCLLVPVLVLAEPTYDEQGDLIRPNTEKYEGTLDGIGEAVQGVVTLVIINDTKYVVDEETIYRNDLSELTSLSSFSQGMYVEYYALDHLVTKMMVSTSTDESDGGGAQEEPPGNDSPGDDLRLEDGVWKN